jgi:hypothetical protein
MGVLWTGEWFACGGKATLEEGMLALPMSSATPPG